jgi:hypothetical protein
MSCHHCVVRPATNSRGHPCARPTCVAVAHGRLRQQLFAGRRGAGRFSPAARGRPGGRGASAVPAHQPGVPGTPGRISGRSGLSAHMAWQDRSRLRRPVTARREEGEETAMFHAGLHIHSKFSRARSRDCDIRTSPPDQHARASAWFGAEDFTHPSGADELKTVLFPPGPGCCGYGLIRKGTHAARARRV